MINNIGGGGHIFESRPFWKRPSFYSTVLMLGFVWAIDISLGSFAFFGLVSASRFQQIAGLVIFVACACAVYLVWFTVSFLSRALCNYAVSVGDGAVTLFVDPPMGRSVQATVRARDIDYLEHFTSTDREALVCHLKDGRIVEIPLWALPDSAREITKLLKAGDVQVLVI